MGRGHGEMNNVVQKAASELQAKKASSLLADSFEITPWPDV